VPIGVVRRGFFPGETHAAIPKFTSNQKEIAVDAKVPVGLHPLESLTPTQQPLEAIKDHVTLITGMDRFYKHGSDVHAQCGSCFLSSATAHSVSASVYPLARTLDHIVADHVGGETPFRTLELSCNSHTDNKESIYFDNISWYDTGYVAPSIRDPRKAFRRLFGTKEVAAFRNITDLVLEDANALQRQLGQQDRNKFAEYFESIRSLELQMERRERLKVDLSQVKLEEPTEAHLPRGEYIRLMGDLMIAALQTGLTNVATLMIGPERWDTPYLYESLFDKPMSHHQMSHNQHKFLNELLQVDRFHMEQFAYLVRRMAQISEADGTSLLDNTLFTYGSVLGDGATHQYTDLPIIVAGSGGGPFRTGQHLHCSDGTPLANLWLTQARIMGLPMQRFADSTGPVESLLV
ncbi:MAG: DUF1552 domain-containing protein, partial [Planctomycetales bacterium]|nr:DUF1552 domain-containing protein [Planctomycetales bacterium]